MFSIMKEYFIDETNKEDVDLSSFELKDELNPKFWKDDKLNILARKKLLIIAKDFISKFEISDFKIYDVVITGSIANYNWNEEYSDIDLHILVDYEEINDDIELVKEFFSAVKSNWNKTHENISIYGFPVEVYVQDINEPHKSTGVYSVLNDEWVVKPSLDNLKDSDYDEDEVQKNVAEIMEQIDDLEERCDMLLDDISDEDADDLFQESIDLFDDIKELRKSDLGTSKNELSTGNLIFKTLRRNGYIEKLIDIRTKVYDYMNSLY